MDSKGQKPSSKNQMGIIIGLDPGMTVGVAILNLSGKILNVSSFKEVSRAEITRHIINYGKAVLVATDVHQTPKMVRKMATALNSKIYFPYRDMAVSAKNELVDDYIYPQDQHPQLRRPRENSDSIPQNAHERDALAAAIQGYKKYQKKLDQIERKTKDLELTPKMVDNIKILVINEVPITKAIKAILEEISSTEISLETTSHDDDPSKISLNVDKPFKDEKKIEDKKLSFDINNHNLEMAPETLSRLQNKLKSQEKQIKNLKKKNSILEHDVQSHKNKISQLENKIERLQYQYSHKLLHQKEIANKTAIIRGIQEKYNFEKDLRKDLEEQLESIKRIRAMELSSEVSPVKIIDSFSKDGIREAASSRNIKTGDVVLLKNSEGGGSQTAVLLIHLGVKAVITADKMSHQAKEEFEKNMIPLIEEENVNLKMADDFAVIMTPDLNREIGVWKKIQEEKKKKEDRNKLLKIMDDYKAQRKRSSNNF